MRARSLFVLASTATAVVATVCCEAYAPATPDAGAGVSEGGPTDGGADTSALHIPTK